MTNHEDVLNNLDVGGVATSALDAASQAGYWILVILIVGAVIWALVYVLSFKHKVSVRLLDRGVNGLPIADRAREIDVDGVRYWKLLKRKHIIPIPPSESLKPLNNKSNPSFYAEFCYSDETGYVPLRYDVTTDNFNDKLMMMRNGRVVSEAFQPFTSNQRSLYVMQIRKAEQMRKKDLLERITQLAVPMVLVFLAILGLVFWEDIAKPAKEMAEINSNMLDTQNVMLSNLNEISAQNARVASIFTGEPVNLTQVVRE